MEPRIILDAVTIGAVLAVLFTATLVHASLGFGTALVSMPLLVIFYLVVPAHALAVFVGFFLLGYLAYEYVHLALHHASPKSRLGCYFRRHHLTHHAHGREGNFGVSSPLWDFLLGTTLRK